ncbi:site-specific integrase [Neobacillus sp. YIM B02564]|uniref:Site-specific integrase n=1 Tax=Neobacillus paridis TaxID=2803862 RepID=A0ABS1TKD1_9BACI|nr:site-specific integrase [Neobacillus paridis]MBL4951469.1 site-specific integrase [Neobacillus paridis]
MNKRKKQSVLFHVYFKEWIELYKDGAVRPVTLQKYWINHQWLVELAPFLTLEELDRKNYQKLLNDFAVTHEKQTTMDFHHQVKGAILDAHDEGLISRDPTRKVVIKGKEPAPKKLKYLNQFELRALLNQLSLTETISWDWFILLVAKTGIRFSEALALTPEDFDFSKQSLSISKTWNYKEPQGGFQPTKNASSIRKVQLDWQTAMQFSQLLKQVPSNSPIFVDGRVFNSTINQRLATYCQKANIPVISLHGLRHTHASLLLFAGVSIASVARRLGHSNMTTTQQTYLHIIQELENQDNEKVMRHLSTLY